MPHFARTLSLVAVLVLGGAGFARAQALPGARPSDTRQEMRDFNAESLRGVSQMLAEWRGAWARHDVRATARYYTDDALLQIGDRKPLQGREAIESGFGGILSTTGVIQVGVEDFSASGNIAYAFGSFWYQAEEGEAAPAVEGRYVMVFRRDGRNWKIRSQMFSAAPARTGAAGEDETEATGAP